MIPTSILLPNWSDSLGSLRHHRQIQDLAIALDQSRSIGIPGRTLT